MASVFNKSALERLSSPEQLDKAITVTNPASWLALIGVTIAIIAVLIWSVFGILPATIRVQGIVTSDNLTDEQIIECFVPYSEYSQIKAGMKAVVYNPSDDSRYDAIVTDVYFDDTEYTDMDLALNSNGIAVTVTLRIDGKNLPQKTAITAKIITEESAPIHKLIKGVS